MLKIINKNHTDQDDKSGAYYFPDISVDKSSKKIMGRKSIFQPISFQRDASDSAHIMGRQIGNDNTVAGIKSNSAETGEISKEVEKRAYENGFKKGEMTGVKLEKRKIRPVIENFYQVISEIEKIKNRLYLNAEEKTVELALAIAKKIVCREINTNKDVILSILKESLKKLGEPETIMVKIRPSDFEIIKSSEFEIAEYFDRIENVTFIKDDTIDNGGCIIETNLGNIDARIEKQFEAVDVAFKSEFQKSQLKDI